ncbi:unnamed protein product [Angiostrongylus costaricensis]|uniref:APG6 domain-containing protein n=1 Tax=Angiostrongylus costaricensis TaxID=334426 RepID=A0A158PL48_ANGCS|nr:unnamed protein product [Angiostrongylus costaricensis]
MDQQLKLLEDDCAVYRQLIDSLKDKHANSDIASYKQTLRNLKDEECALKAQFDQLCLEEERLDSELVEKRMSLEKKTEEEAKRWLQFRDNHRRLLAIDEKTRIADAELRYAAEQHRRLANTNALDLFIGEINGFRLGRLPDRLVDWPEINAAWGQLVLLLDVLMQRVNVKQDSFKLITMGSHSYIKYKRTTTEEVKYPLFASGSWKPFGNNNMDSGIMAYLQCFEVLRTAIQFLVATFNEKLSVYQKPVFTLCSVIDCYFHYDGLWVSRGTPGFQRLPTKQNSRFEIPHRINKDCIAHGTMEYSVKMLLNKEERWTKAMKLLLTNLRTTMVQIIAIRPITI